MNDFQIVIRLNEQVKQVSRLSDCVFIVALNAMFQARRAHALGFNTVTGELRKFSTDISEVMIVLKETIDLKVELITRYQHKKHLERLVNRIVVETSNKSASRHALKMEANIQRQVASLEERFVEYSKTFSRALRKAARVCEVGHSLYIHARVEAQSAGEYTGSLMPVVEQIEDAVSKLDNLLSQIQSLTALLTLSTVSHNTVHSQTGLAISSK